MSVFQEIGRCLGHLAPIKAAQGIIGCIKDNKWVALALLYGIVLHFGECAGLYSIGDMNLRKALFGLDSWMAVYGICLLTGGRAAKLLLSFVLVVQSIVSFCSMFLSTVFSLPLRADAFAVLAVSSTAEIEEFCKLFLGAKVLALLLVGFAVMTLAVIAVWKSPVRRTIWLCVCSGLLLLPQAVDVLQCIAKKETDNSYLYICNPVARLIDERLKYSATIARLSYVAQAPELPIGIVSDSSGNDFLAVLVVGESDWRFHHSLYGYPRDTNPLLGAIQDELLIFSDVISGHAHTVKSIAYMFTVEDQQHQGDYRYTMFDVFNRAGFKISFFSNQARWGQFDSPISLITAHAGERVYVQERQFGVFDDALLQNFNAALSTNGNKLIVLHLMGSHTEYQKRSPVAYKVFNYTNRIKSPYPVDDWESLDEYDNSLVFTDAVLRQVVERLERFPGSAFMLYCPDHGEFPERLFSKPRSGASKYPECYEIPFIFYANPVYRGRYPRFLDGVRNNLKLPFVTDHLMFPLFSAARITFDGFPHDCDLFSPEYVPPAKRQLGSTGLFYKSRDNPYLQVEEMPNGE